MTTPHLLFAYGTLMAAACASEPSGLGAGERRRLAREGHLIGGATMAGWLYDLGSYPGLVEKVGVTEGVEAATLARVSGELWRLNDPVATFAWLDRYEGIDPAWPDRSEYCRQIRQVVVAIDQRTLVDAWVYLYVGDASAAQPVASGSWSRRG